MSTNLTKVDNLKRERDNWAKKAQLYARIAQSKEKEADDCRSQYRAVKAAMARIIVRLANVGRLEDAMDDNTGEVIGRRLVLPPMTDADIMRYEVHSRRDEDGTAVIGVGLRDHPEDTKSDKDIDDDIKAIKEAGNPNDRIQKHEV